jgi:hypothetical protein
MNGEVSVLVERRTDVLAVSNDAVRTVREAPTAAPLLGLDADSVAAQLRAQQAAAAASAATRPAGRPPGRAPRAAAGAPAAPQPGGVRARTAVVFVRMAAGGYAPRLVRLGATNYDHAEVLAGVVEGDTVALLNVALLQARREQQNARFRASTGGGVPGMTAPAGGAAGGAGGGARPSGR